MFITSMYHITIKLSHKWNAVNIILISISLQDKMNSNRVFYHEGLTSQNNIAHYVMVVIYVCPKTLRVELNDNRKWPSLHRQFIVSFEDFLFEAVISWLLNIQLSTSKFSNDGNRRLVVTGIHNRNGKSLYSTASCPVSEVIR